jgi:hypothetical protein
MGQHPAVSDELARLIGQSRPRSKAEPTGHMRERIAVALRGARPSYFLWYPVEAYTLFLYEPPDRRRFYEEWADRLLAHFDVLDLELVDKRADSR